MLVEIELVIIIVHILGGIMECSSFSNIVVPDPCAVSLKDSGISCLLIFVDVFK